MKYRLKEKHQEAVRLRIEERQSYGYISKALKVSKGTLSLWLRDHPLMEAEKREKCGYNHLIAESTVCKICGDVFERTNARKIHCSDGCRIKFKSCKKTTNAERVVTWQQRQKRKAVEYKGGKCVVCGYNKSIRALKFHHLDPTEKDFGISQKGTRSWEKMKVELDKCILVCGNCHDEIHDELVLNSR